MRRFEGYGAIVTGGARGIGAATVRRLAAEGARVLVADIDADAAKETAEAVDGAEAYRVDVADRASVEAAVAYAAGTFGSLDVLVNNALSALDHQGPFEDLPDEGWARDIDICLSGAMRCARAALPYLAGGGSPERGTSGRGAPGRGASGGPGSSGRGAAGRGAIVNIGSVNAEQSFGGHAYSAAKAGLASLTRTLAGEAAPRGVRVNQVNPGTVRTRAWEGRADVLDALAEVYPLGRVGEPEDIAAAVAFLASRDAAWITGTTLRVDGGLLAVNTGFHRAAERASAPDRDRDLP
ncbi:SDR family oxidoreductase [Streptomyces sp. NPDC005805]|uniref:SDR family NAD(P)-dependent oxidoreductase n=1 Tax=Streptomyces sp. NPDC005805 TaxID=3157068 RepID=UPI0034046828